MKHSNRAIIESHQEPSALTSIAARYNVDWTISKVPWVWRVTKPYLNIVGSDWMGQGLDPATPHAPYTHQSLCTSYYTDNSNYTQGPSSSATMLGWLMVCYFVLGLLFLLQREHSLQLTCCFLIEIVRPSIFSSAQLRASLNKHECRRTLWEQNLMQFYSFD